MKKRIIVYLLVTALTFYCFFMYENSILSGFLAAEVVYFAAAFVELLSIRKKVEIAVDRILPVAEKGQTVSVQVSVQNQSFMPGIHYRVRGLLSNQFTGESRKFMMKGSVLKKERAVNILSFRPSSCGNMIVSVDELCLYDALGIFVLRKKVMLRRSIGVLPECHVLPLEITKRTREFVADAEEFSDRESGDDPSEIYQIREYREKDSIHDIHWKLSAKSDELLVKEHGRPLGCVVLMWIDLEKAPVGGNAGKKNFRGRHLWRKGKEKGDQTPALVLEAAASLSISLLEEKCIHMAAWYEKQNKRIIKKRISKEEHVYEVMHRLLFAEMYEGSEAIDSIRKDAFKTEEFSSTVEFDMKGRIFVNGSQSFQLNAEKDIDWGKLVLTV